MESIKSFARDQKSPLWLALCVVYFWAFSGMLIPALGHLHRSADGKIFTSIDLADVWSGRLGFDLFTYLGAFLLVYSMLAWLVWWSAGNLSRFFRLPRSGQLLMLLVALTLTLTWFQLWNARAYPRSKVEYFDQSFALSEAGGWLLVFQSGLVILFFVSSLFLYLLRSRQTQRRFIVVSGSILAATTLFISLDNKASEVQSNQVNVILIGVDSLRTDSVGYFGSESGLTPNIDRFLKTASVFTRTYTPLARTFPAWMSVLTGKYPRNNGARYNLISPSRISQKSSIAWKFDSLGYETMLAMDERRFANIDAEFGFTREIGPTIGAGDFLLASVNDTPLTNLLLGTRLGKTLFPFNDLNRAVDRLYYPDIFDQRLSDELRSRGSDRPLFLLAHFCIPHWPYGWAEPVDDLADPEANRRYGYDRAVERADRQFTRLWDTLNDSGLLEDAIVVLISDHGESLGEGLRGWGDSKISSLLTRGEWGHGTNVFRDEQYQVVMAMRGYGKMSYINGRRIDSPASLVDIAPTLFDLLNVDAATGTEFDGLSLLGSLSDDGPAAERPIYLESGFSIPAILAVDPSLQDVFDQGFQHYHVNPENGRMEIRSESHQIILDAKQRGLVYGDWQLATVKDPDSGEFDYGLRHLSDNRWTDDLTSTLAAAAPVSEMLRLLSEHFGDEVELPKRLGFEARPWHTDGGRSNPTVSMSR